MKKPVSLLRLVSAAALALPVLVHAAGLGRLTVQSYLGQPLRAEIEVVSLQAGEEASLEARLASGNAFAQAGIEFNAALNGMRFAVDKRGGKPVILVTTRQPVNEPFLDVLVELRWSTGLFVREYTILLDPPGFAGPKAQPAVAAPGTTAAEAAAPAAGAPERAPPGPTTSEITPAPRVEERPMESAAVPEPKPGPSETTKPAPTEGAAASSAPVSAAPPAAAAAPAVPEGPQTYEVKKGDTLGEIALRYRPAGITYHQMLIALQRANEDAFIRDNINLVRAGAILNIPDADAAAAVEPSDANRLVYAQHADFADYRSRLAGAVAAAPSAPKPAEQSAAGPITVQPETPKPAASKDQLKLSRADTKKPGAAASKAAREDDLAAKQRALEESQSRVTELEKNVADLQKLLEIRNEQLAQLQDKASAKPAPAAPVAAAPKPAASAPKPAAAAPEAPKPAAEAPKPPAAAETPKPTPAAPKPAAATPAAPKPAATAPKPAAAAPKPPAKPRPKPRPVAPPPPEPSFLDEFLEDPTIALGGVAIVLLLLGGYGYWAWQRKKKSVAKFKDSVLGGASLAPAAGADAAAGPVSVSQASVTQSTAGGVDADDVDPIAEADVYMAYGRDAQAEEILREALQRDPNRLAVHAKLLEIYANRRDAQSFEQTALKLRSATGGTGPEWDKAMAMGRSIDPGNGLYGGAGETTPAPVPAFAAAAAAAPAAPAVDFDIGGGGPAEPAAPAAPAVDLDISGPTPPAAERSDFSPSGTLIIDDEESKAAASNGLDFDLGGGGDDKAADTGGGLNFELPGSAPAAEEAPAAAPEAASSSGGLDFDLNLGGGGESKEGTPPALDLSAISLDLGTPGEAPAAGSGNGNGGDPKWQEVATKLDLAKAYEEMGDKDGARELLNEVLREGDSAQQGQANQLLAKLG